MANFIFLRICAKFEQVTFPGSGHIPFQLSTIFSHLKQSLFSNVKRLCHHRTVGNNRVASKDLMHDVDNSSKIEVF